MMQIEAIKAYKEQLAAGFTDEQATASVAALYAAIQNVATKEDLSNSVSLIRQEMAQGFESLRKEIETSRKEFKTEMDLFKIEVKSDMRNARLWENFKFALLQIEMVIVMGTWVLPSLQKWFPL